jgi:hypothetical protein
MFLMIGIGIVVGMFVRNLLPEGTHTLIISLVKLLLLPITMGVGYEILMLAGKHDNFLTRMISAPGMWVQKITTKEPTLDMLEVAIISTKCALRDEFPEFMEFWNERSWEPKAEESDKAETENATAEAVDDTVEVAEDTAEVTEATVEVANISTEAEEANDNA